MRDLGKLFVRLSTPWHRRVRHNVVRCLAASTMMLWALGCNRSDHHTHDDAHAHAQGHGHHHEPPHGGTPVVLGDEAYHLEFILDPTMGELTCYILDGHMEQFVRIDSEDFELKITRADATLSVTLNAVANRATGETVGDSSQFTGQADELKDASSFDAVLKEIVIQGKSYVNVGFSFPEGTE